MSRGAVTRHPVDTAALRVLKRMRTDTNLALTEARKREHNGSGWENRAEAERRIRIFDEMIQAVEGLPDDV